MAGIDDYAGLAESGFEGGKPQTKPEDEFYHSLYISGKPRKNHVDILEQAGKLQIRGVKYNLDTVSMIITAVKKVLTKEETVNGQTRTACFSWKAGQPPFKGTSGIQCGINSAERAANNFCSTCKEQIIVAGILCSDSGKPEVKDGKPIFVFLRAKGMKYSNVANYLSDLVKLDLSPIIEPVTEESKKLEKVAINNKRFVTNISIGSASSKYGLSSVFEMAKGIALSDNDVKKVLELSKKTLDQFNEKFDWSKRSNSGASSSYAPKENQFGGDEKKEEPKKEDSGLSFDDIEF